VTNFFRIGQPRLRQRVDPALDERDVLERGANLAGNVFDDILSALIIRLHPALPDWPREETADSTDADL
jgi:hypothetical protein